MKREAAAREKRARFIAATEKGLAVSAAAEVAGVNRTLLYKWRQRDPDFARQWDDATTAATEAMEDEALHRALEGVEKPVFYRGKQVGSFRSYNDRLLILLLQRRRPSPDQQEALRVAEAQLGARLKAVEQREAAVREREEVLRKMSPTVSQSCLPPEGEGGAQRRKGDAATRTGAARVAPSPFRPFGAPSPCGGRPMILSPAVSVPARPPVPSPTVSVPSHAQQGTALKAAAGSAGILPGILPASPGGTPALPGNALFLSPTVSVPPRVPMLAIADHVYGRHYKTRAGFRLAVPLLQRASSTTHTPA